MESNQQQRSNLIDIWKDLFAGTIGGFCQVITGQPFDIIKVRLQRQSATNPHYLSILDCVNKTFRNEGLSGFYKGTLSPLSGVGVCCAIRFAGNGLSKRIIENYHRIQGKEKPEKLATHEFMFSGAVGGMLNTIISCPVEHIRIVMQSQTNSKQTIGRYSGSYDWATKIYNLYGLSTLFRGFQITLLRNTIGTACQFGCYESFKSRSQTPPSIPYLILYGALAGECFWLSIYPIDLVKTKIQSDSLECPRYRGVGDVVRQVYLAEGLKGFTKGILPWVMRTPITSASTFLGYEMTMRYFERCCDD